MIEFSNLPVSNFPALISLDRQNLQEILDMTPGYLWNVTTTYRAGEIVSRINGQSFKLKTPYDHSLNPQQMHLKGAISCMECHFRGKLSSFKLIGWNVNSDGYVFSFL